MATITAGSSKTFTAQVDNSSFVVIAPGGSIGQVVDQNGNIQPIGPNGTRRTFGPLNELQSITVSMQIGNSSVELNGWSGGIPITAETNSTGQTVLDDASRAALSASGVNIVPSSVLVPDVYLPAGVQTLAAALPKTKAMFNKVLGGGRGLIVINGDSTTTGFTGVAGNLNNPNSARRSLASTMARALRRFGIHAHANGFCGDQAVTTLNVTANNPNIILGSGVTTDFAGAIGGNFFKLLGSGALSWVGTEPFDTVFVDYLTTNASGGDLTVDIGGSTLATLPSLQASGIYTSGPISLGAPGLYTVNVKRAAGATIQGNVIGVRCYNSANPGVLVMCVGGAGKTSANLTQGGAYGYVNSYAMLSPDLVVCGEQINDWDTDVPVGTHATNIATMITQSKNSGNSDVILLGGPRSGAAIASLPSQEAYRASDIATAYAGGVAMLDFWGALGPNDGGNPALYGDSTGHLTEAGYGAFGYGLARRIASEFAF